MQVEESQKRRETGENWDGVGPWEKLGWGEEGVNAVGSSRVTGGNKGGSGRHASPIFITPWSGAAER